MNINKIKQFKIYHYFFLFFGLAVNPPAKIQINTLINLTTKSLNYTCFVLMLVWFRAAVNV